jgi:hypothetical protein
MSRMLRGAALTVPALTCVAGVTEFDIVESGQ